MQGDGTTNLKDCISALIDVHSLKNHTTSCAALVAKQISSLPWTVAYDLSVLLMSQVLPDGGSVVARMPQVFVNRRGGAAII
jgi:hypothetical protein